MREVGVVVPQRERRERVDRLRDEQPARAKLGRGELQQPHQRRRGHVLDELRREDPAERAVIEAMEILDCVRVLDLEPFAARVGDHIGVEVDASRLDPRLTEQREELTAATAQVQHGRRVAEVVDVGALALADALGGPRMRLSKAK